MNTIIGSVVHGKHMGRALGFPTANIKPLSGQRVPKNGVYLGMIRIGDERALRRCVINHGLQPTLPSGQTTIEVHILDFDEDIYGQSVALRFEAFIRPEQRFENLEQLKAQLTRDIEFARNWNGQTHESFR